MLCKQTVVLHVTTRFTIGMEIQNVMRDLTRGDRGSFGQKIHFTAYFYYE